VGQATNANTPAPWPTDPRCPIEDKTRISAHYWLAPAAQNLQNGLNIPAHPSTISSVAQSRRVAVGVPDGEKQLPLRGSSDTSFSAQSIPCLFFWLLNLTSIGGPFAESIEPRHQVNTMRRHSNKPRSPPRSITSARSSGDFSRVRSPLPKVRSGRATVRVSDDSNPACLSALPHVPDPDPDSLFHHFLGCLEFHQRDHFLDYQVEYWTTQVEEIVHFEASRAKAREQGIDKQELLEAAEDRVRKTIQALAISIEAQYKRTAVLRRAFSKQNFTPGCDAEEDYHFDAPRDPPGQPPGIRVVDEPDPGSLVWYINKSRSEWRSSMEYTAGIEKVREWRRHLGFPTDTATVNFDDTGEPEVEPGRRRVQEIVRELRGEESITKENISEYVLERDVNAHLIQYTRQSKLMAATGAGRKSILPLDLKMRHLPARPYEENLEDVRFKGKFPDQRVSVDLLLRSAHTKAKEYNRDIPQEDSASSGAHRNILSKDECDQKDPTRMRYLHIPANNMEVRMTITRLSGHALT